MRQRPPLLLPAIAAGAAGLLVWAELERPLRRPTRPKLERDLRNLAVAALSAATIAMLEKPLVAPLSRRVERRRLGLLPRLGLPGWLETALAVVLMDYTLYLWHVATHRLPFLWRFHRVHHADLDLDASTAIRFHFAEMGLSVPYRLAQVALIGVKPAALSLWRGLLMASILFHHSNLRLPMSLERRLVRLITTPRMHGIHHSTVPQEVNSNWSSGLTLWDRLHGTLKLDTPQASIEIGLADARDPAALTLGKLLIMPFRREPARPPPVRPAAMEQGKRNELLAWRKPLRAGRFGFT